MTRGTTVLIEIVFNLYNIFSNTPSLIDLTNPIISITAPDNSIKVSSQPLANYDTGKWYYTLSSQSTWPKGYYTIEVSGTYNTLPIKKIHPQAFVLE